MYSRKKLRAFLVLLTAVLLVSVSVQAERAEPACHIEIYTDPPDTLRVVESGQSALTVSAHFYHYQAREINLYAESLPSFIQGWDNVTDNCGNCTISDEMTVNPGDCDRGTYRIVFRAEAGDVYDELAFYVVVEPGAGGGEISAPSELSACSGEEINFQVCYQPDRNCPGDPEPVWYISGYPMDNGAGLDQVEGDPLCREFSWVPSYSDTGMHRLLVTVEENSFLHTAELDLQVLDCGCLDDRVEIIEEPDFSRGTTNRICYRPNCSAYDHDIYYFNIQDPGSSEPMMMKSPSDSDRNRCEDKSDLMDGATYGFYVTAFFSSGSDTMVSDTTYTTQDASAPPAITTLTAEADSGGVIRTGWYGVKDQVSGVEYYEISRKERELPAEVIATVAALPGNGPDRYYRYTDSITAGTGLEEGKLYRYLVRAVDRVGLAGGSDITGPVVPDATPPCVPAVEIFDDINGIYADRFAFKEGVLGEARGRSACRGLAAANFIQFECARDSIKFFDSQWMPGSKFFRSGWIECDSTWVQNGFNLLPPGSDSSFVNGHLYLFRARARDSVGNISKFSCSPLRPNSCDTLEMDIFPPGDVLNLTVTPGMTRDSEAYCMDLSWEETVDRESGLESYRIYRRLPGSSFQAAAIDIRGKTFRDTLAEQNLMDGGECCYFVGAVDRVGNIRNYQFPEEGDYTCARIPSGPDLYPECDLSVGEDCFVRDDTVSVQIDPDFDNGNLNSYIFECGDDTISFYNTDSYIFKLPLPTEGFYRIRVKAEYNDGLKSLWSSPRFLTRDSSPSQPVLDLAATGISAGCGGYQLSWSEPEDRITEVAGYRVWKYLSRSDSLLVAETPDTSACVPFQDDTTYKYYRFSVQPVDLLGNVRETGNSQAEAYCARAPVISCDDSPLWENRCIDLSWSAPRPSIGTELSYQMHVTSEGAGVDTTIYGIGDTGIRYCAYQSGYYSVRVRETAGSPGLESQWSAPCIIPFKSKPEGVSSFTLQPQPLEPGADRQSGIMDLHWEYGSMPGIVEHFRIERSGGEGNDRTWMVPYNPPDSIYSMRDDSLDVDYIYTYRISPVDRSGQSAAADSCSAAISPAWAYTPRVSTRGGIYFAGDSVRIGWEWAGTGCEAAQKSRGAEYCLIQVSNSPGFSQVCESGWLPAGQMGARLDVSSLLNPSTYQLYCRVKGRDRWGNESPWSDQYGECFSDQPAVAVHDENPPWPVDRLSVYAVRADSSSAPDSVDVFLSWTGTEDVLPGSGMGHYAVYRSSPGENFELISAVTDTFAVDRGVRAVEANNCLFQYTVRPVDRLGNQQNGNNGVSCLEVLPAPDSVRAISARKIIWQYPGEQPVDGFIAECSNYSGYLGTELMKFLEDEAVAIIEDAGVREYTFNTGTDFIQNDTIYFHIKAYRGDYQSCWSKVFRYPDGEEPPELSRGYDTAPGGFRLYQNHPNPFNPITMISFDLPCSAEVRLVVYDVRGRVVRELAEGRKNSGRYSIPWDGRNSENRMVSSGVYFYRLTAAGRTETRKMILLR
ncbi:MAG: T9SS type A sorting domain-containing protein [Candidatus Latescibacteria bacterium]|nr:T9SS type A sorting domain-containing protein [bacterium]MBD3424796.1 T9SS type A sorting domain-containing protein [Candidatus Latescibacterota bacterium]